MKKIILIISLIFAVAFIVRPLLLGDTILFPSNLLVSTYAPWKYQPSADYPNGPSNKPIGFDNIRQHYPNRKILSEEIKRGVIPLWNPYIYSGAPFMAAFDTTVWYPLTWISNLLPPVDAWNFLVLIQPVLSFVFMFLFLRSLSLNKGIGFFGAFVYTFSGWMIVYWQEALVVEHSFLWLPLALYASNRLWILHSDKVSWGVLVFALTCSIFGGFFQMSLYVYITVAAWNIFRYRAAAGSGKTKSFRSIACAILLSLIIASIQLIPSIEAFLLAPRSVGDGAFVFRDFLLPLQHLMTFIAPDFWGNPATYNYFRGRGFYFEKMLFIGLAPLVFALYSFGAVKESPARFWKVFGLVVLSMGFALPTSWWPYYLRIPVLANSYPTRIFALSLFSFIVLSSYGLQAFMEKPKYKHIACILVFLTLIVTGAWMFVAGMRWGWFTIPSLRGDAHLYASVSFRNLIVPSVLLLSVWILTAVSKVSMKTTYIGVWIISIASSWYFAQKYVYTAQRRFLYPDLAVTKKITDISGYDRIWGFGNAFIETNLPLYYRWFSTDGYSGLSSTRYAQLLSTITNNGKILLLRRSDSDLYHASERDSFSSNNPYRLRIMELLGVKYVLESKKGELKDTNTTENRFSKNLFSLLWEDDTWRIWHYKPALPRVMLARSYIVRSGDQQIIDALYDPAVRLDDTVVLEQTPDVMIAPEYSGNQASVAAITSYDLNSVTVSTSSPVSGFLLLTDNYYPGWKAYLDGKEQKIYRADYSFRSVFVPSGVHTVTFVYLPFSVIFGGILSLAGIAASIGCWKLIAGRNLD